MLRDPPVLTALRGSGPQPVEKRSVVDLVVDEVRRSIVDGSLVAGVPISIAALSARLGVSHIPVREGLRRLEGQGVIEFRQGRSAIVAPVGLDDLKDLLAARLALESELCARAVRVAGPGDLAAAQRALSDLDAVGSDDVRELAVRHRALHRQLVCTTTTSWEARLSEALDVAFDRYVPLLLASGEGARNLAHEHERLIAAFRSADPREARAAVREHVEATSERLGPMLGRT
ncbi:MAG: GntR family transcriptional regulator [Acidimicrobiales bacterium]